MKKITFLILTIALIVSHAVNADCFNTVDDTKIQAAINDKNDSYGDVPSTINCKKTTTKVSKLICSNNTLQLMELLDSKAYVYALENATHQEVNHKKTKDTDWIKGTRNQCKDESCLCEAFKEHTNSSLGGMSPYEQQ